MPQILPSELINNLRAVFQPRKESQFHWKSIVSMHQAIPGLRGLWAMSTMNSSGDCIDKSGLGKLLTYAGNPTYGYENLIPYIDFDGTGDYLTRADEADLDITGTESYITTAARGIAMGCWFKPDDSTPATTQYLISKMGAVGNFSYQLVLWTTGAVIFRISVDGTNWTSVTSTNLADTSWNHAVGVFDPGSSISVWLNGTETQQATATASVFNGNGPLNLSGYNNGNGLYSGLMSMGFLGAEYLSDAIVQGLYHQSKTMYNRE